MSGRWRALLVTLGALVLLGGAAAGFLVTARLGPERLRQEAEEWLGARLGPVSVGSIHLGFHWGPAIEARDLHTLPDPTAPPSATGFSADRVKVSLDLWSLLRGELRLGRVKVWGLRAGVARSAGGTLAPEAARRLAEALGGAETGQGAPEGVDEALRRLRHAAARLPTFIVDGGALDLGLVGADGRDHVLALRGLQLTLGHAPLVGSLGLSAAGQVLEDGDDRGGLQLRGALPLLRSPDAELTLSRVDLRLLGAWLPPALRTGRHALAGRVSGRFTWRPGASGAQEFELEAVGLDLHVPVGAGGLALPSARIAAAAALASEALDVSHFELHSGAFDVSGRLHASRPWKDGSDLEIALDGEPFDVGALRDLLDASGRLGRQVNSAMTAGRLGPWAVRCTGTTLRGLRAFAASPLTAWPSGLDVEVDVADGTVALGDGPPIHDLTGHVSLGRDRVALAGMSGRYGDDPLPTLDLTVTGMQAVITSLTSGHAPPPVQPLPGWLALGDWVDSVRRPGPPRWQRADIELDRLSHPVLIRTVRDLHAVLTPDNPGFTANVTGALWGSAEVSGRVRRFGGSPGRLTVDFHADPATAPPPGPPSDATAWAIGRFQVDLTKLGPFQASWVTGQVRIEGERAEIREGDSALTPRGRLSGEVDLHLSQRDAVPYEARLAIRGGAVTNLLDDLHLDGEEMTGTADLKGTLRGRLVAGVNVMVDMTGPIEGKLTDGEIHKHMNLLLAIAAASDTLNPFRSRETLPYDTIEGKVQLDHGTIRADSLSLTGPAVRLVATGSVNALDPPNAVQAVVGVFFFRTLDTVISKVPLVNKLLLGNDKNFVAAYVSLEGPWGDPKARILPSTLLTSGPAGIVTEGVPAFVRSGISTLQHLLGIEPGAERKRAAAGDAPPKQP
jgi:hypothetical protein